MATRTKPETRGTTADATPSIIAAGVKIDGNITAAGEIHLDGHITGNLVCSGLTMGEESRVEGSIQASSAIIRGTIIGELTAGDVRLEKTSVLEGDVFHKSLSVEAGAKITGRFIHGDKANQNTDVASVEPVSEEAQKPSAKLEAAE